VFEAFSNPASTAMNLIELNKFSAPFKTSNSNPSASIFRSFIEVFSSKYWSNLIESITNDFEELSASNEVSPVSSLIYIVTLSSVSSKALLTIL